VSVGRSARGPGWYRVVVGPDLPSGHLPVVDEPSGDASGDVIEVLVHGHGPTHVDLEVLGGVSRRVTVRERPTATGEPSERHERRLYVRLDGRWRRLRAEPRFPHRVADEQPGTTTAPMPGTVTTVAVAVGETVRRGDLLVTLEAMKMEHRVTADVDGVVAEL